MDSHLQVWRRFWFAHPALALAFGACLGCAIALGATSSLWIAPFLLLAGIPRWKLLTVAAALLYLWTSHLILLPPQSKIQGTATFSIDSIHQRERHGKLSWELRGTLHSFSEGQTPVASNLPFALALPRQQVLPSLQYRYRAPACLDWKGMGAASLKIDRTVKWERDRLQPSLAWVRWLSQERLRDYLSSKLPHKGARELLIGLATGSFEDRHLLMDYRRCGLSHILAVSGFHFSLLALLIGFLVRLVSPIQTSHGILIGLLTLFFLFIGNNPSIARSWIACVIALSGLLVGKQTFALNNLGIAATVLLLWDPLLIHSLAFQFSFSATAGLLLFMPLMDQMLTWLIVPRRLRILIHMPMSEQIAYVLLTYLRKATALSLAVNLSTGPLILYHLHKIPWIGLFFNLFYPLCIALALGWLVLNLVLGLSLPPIADIFFKGLSVFTDYLVHIVSDVPLVLLGELYAENIASSFLLAWYGLLCCAGVVAACQSQRWKKTALWTIA